MEEIEEKETEEMVEVPWEEIEESDEFSEESEEPLETIIEESSQNVFRDSGEQVNPFLEAEPIDEERIENLEEDLGDVATQTGEEEMVYNASATEGDYTGGINYETQKDYEAGYPETMQTTSPVSEPFLTQDFREIETNRFNRIDNQRFKSSDELSSERYPKTSEEKKYESRLEQEFRKRQEERRRF